MIEVSDAQSALKPKLKLWGISTWKTNWRISTTKIMGIRNSWFKI